MTDPRRITAHLAEELAAVGAPASARDEGFGRNRLVAVCDVPGVATFGTDGLRVWWQIRGQARRHQTCVPDGGLARARGALVQAVYATGTPHPAAGGDRGDDARAAHALAHDLTRHLPRSHRVAVIDDAPWPVTVRVHLARSVVTVGVADGWYVWPDPAPDLSRHLVGLRRCLHDYRHIAVARLLELLRSRQVPGGLAFPAGRPPDRPGAAA